MVDYQSIRYTCTFIKNPKKIIKYKKKEKLSGKWLYQLMSPLLARTEPFLVYCRHCVHEHISPLLGEHLGIVNIFLGPVTVHYREVSLYNEMAGLKNEQNSFSTSTPPPLK